MYEAHKTKWVLIGALGTGCIVGISGLFLFQRLLKKTDGLIRQEIESLQAEILQLQNTLAHQPRKSAIRNVTFAEVDQSFREQRNMSSSIISCSEMTGDFYSTISSLGDSDDFYDVEDEDESPETLSREEAETLHLFSRVDELLEGKETEHQIAFRLLSEREKEMSQNSEFLWRCCKCFYIISLSSEKSVVRSLIEKSSDYGRRSLEINNGVAEAHKWFAIAYVTLSDYYSLSEKIKRGFTFKKHIDIAAQLAPFDSSIQHLLGRFCYEVSELSWLERKMATALFSSLPQASMSEALSHFLRAEELKPEGWTQNRLYLAKCQDKLGNHLQVLHWLDLAASTTPLGLEDQNVMEDVKKMLVNYEKYRSSFQS